MGKLLKFAGNKLNRLEVERREEEWIEQKFKDPKAKVIIYCKSKILINNNNHKVSIKFISLDQLKKISEKLEYYLIGSLDGETYLTSDLSKLDEKSVNLLLTNNNEFIDCRTAGESLSQQEGGLISQSKSQLEWNIKNSFCGICGGKTKVGRGGQVRKCLKCKTEHFPRTDPVIITLVVNGDYCLLGQSKGRLSRLNIYSALAGFIDQGESIEEAVAREIMEESGIEVEDVKYYASQPWPFPWSLMIGCHAKAKTKNINYDEYEMLSVKWFHKDEIIKALNGENNNLSVPGSIAIAHHLIKAWAYGEV
jgi:NAD+ diphosphatase